MSVCQSLTALLTQDPSRDSSASRCWWSGFVPSVWEPSEDVVAVSPGSIKGLGSCSGSRGQRVVPGKAQALPLLILPPFQKNLGMILRTVPQLKVMRHHVLHILPPHAPSALPFQAQHSAACLPSLLGSLGLSPLQFPLWGWRQRWQLKVRPERQERSLSKAVLMNGFSSDSNWN